MKEKRSVLLRLYDILGNIPSSLCLVIAWGGGMFTWWGPLIATMIHGIVLYGLVKEEKEDALTAIMIFVIMAFFDWFLYLVLYVA